MRHWKQACAGKTSVLDAAATALSVWLVHPPDSRLVTSRRFLSVEDKRLMVFASGDRTLLAEAKVPVYFEHRLASLKKDGPRIVEITCENGDAFAKAFSVTSRLKTW